MTRTRPAPRRIIVTATAVRRAILAALPEAQVTVEQTGGGTATIYIGEYDEETGRATFGVGPGRFNWRDADLSLFWLGEDRATNVGVDDEDGPSEYVATLAEITAFLASHFQCEGYNVAGRWTDCARTDPHGHGILSD